ncbi:CUB domain-containing protein 2-like isoform X2 [Ptychodera flava]
MGTKMMVNRTALLALLCVFLTNIMHHAFSAKNGGMQSDLLEESRNHRVRRGSKRACGRTFNTSSGIFTSPYYPDDYPSNLNCTYFIHGNGLPDSRIQLKFVEFSLSNTDEVVVYDGNDTSKSTVIGPFVDVSIDQLPIIRSSGSSLTVQFLSTRSTLFSSGHRFYAEYKTVQSTSDCGGIFTAITGTIASPYYPESYPRNVDCYYFIIVPEDTRVMLQFQLIDLEHRDTLDIYDGFTVSINHYLGNGYGSYYMSDNHAMLVRFQSGSYTSQTLGSGFYAKYSRDTCGGTYSSNINEGYIISPLYPDFRKNFFDIDNCYYNISVSDGYTVQVEFIEFGLQPCCAHLSIYDGTSGDSPLVGKYTGYVLPRKIEATGSNLFLHYHGARFRYSTSRGFYLVYHNGFVDAYGPFSVCGNNIAYGLNGLIYSHSSYPSDYPSNQNCSITILTAGEYNYVAFKLWSLIWQILLIQTVARVKPKMQYESMICMVWWALFVPMMVIITTRHLKYDSDIFKLRAYRTPQWIQGIFYSL